MYYYYYYYYYYYNARSVHCGNRAHAYIYNRVYFVIFVVRWLGGQICLLLYIHILYYIPNIRTHVMYIVYIYLYICTYLLYVRRFTILYRYNIFYYVVLLSMFGASKQWWSAILRVLMCLSWFRLPHQVSLLHTTHCRSRLFHPINI
jgi:hypothetical protein